MATSDYTSEPIQIYTKSGHIGLIDLIDSDLASLKWCINGKATKYPYLIKNFGKSHTPPLRLLHRVIMERIVGRTLISKEVVDHINQNTLDNRRCNLRLCSHAENLRNGKMRPNNTTGYKGVTYVKRDKKYIAVIHYNNEQINLGRFKTAEDAYQAYCEASKKYHGEFGSVK